MPGVRAVGSVRFDHEDPAQGGWACVAGGKPFRISTVGGLDNATLWIMNLPFAVFQQNGLNRTAHFKRTTYLNAWQLGGQRDIAQNWGLLPRNYTEAQITAGMAAIASNTLGFAFRRYGIDITRSVPVYDGLSDEIRAKLLPVKDKRLGPEIDTALQDAHQYFTHCVMGPVRRDEYVDVRFVVPAVSYGAEVLGTPIPGDQVDFLGDADLPPQGDRVAWVLASDRPVLARVVVSNVSPEVAALIAHANGARTGSTRQWVSQPELMLLRRYADVEVDAVMLFRRYEELPENCQLPQFTALQAMTPSAELLAANHWTGLCRENPWRLDQVPTDQRGLSPRAVWITAIDRFLMFTYAYRLHKAGLMVRLYGGGAVVVAVPKHAYREAFEIAAHCGLLAPTQISSDIDIQEDLAEEGASASRARGGDVTDLASAFQRDLALRIAEDGDPRFAIQLLLRDTRNLDHIMALDRLVVMPETKAAMADTMNDLRIVKTFIEQKLPASLKSEATRLFIEHAAAIERSMVAATKRRA